MEDITHVKKHFGPRMSEHQENNKTIIRRPNGSKAVKNYPTGETLTQQQFKDESDVNQIMKKYKATGTITHVRNASTGAYMDLTEAPSYQDALHVIIQAEQAFEQVPAEIRNRFNHDPQKFIDFLSDEKNNEEAIKLGLKVKREETKPDPLLTELQTISKNTAPKKRIVKDED